MLEAAPRYSELITGVPPHVQSAEDFAEDFMDALPPGKGSEDKFVLGFFLDDQAVGCADLIRYYPDNKTAMLGLLLITESHQGKGFGKEALGLLEGLIKRWSGTERIRAGVLAVNSQVVKFWERQGFKNTGEKKSPKNGKTESEVWVFEKKIRSEKLRSTLCIELTEQEFSKQTPMSSHAINLVRPENAGAIGKLMERAFRDTIDDEGETAEHFIAEMRATMAGKYGPYIQEASYWIEQEGQPVAATLITLWKEKPLLAFSVTEPAFQRQGLAEFLIRKSMNTLFKMGHAQMELGVTRGNESAERLYRKLGFRVK